MMVWSEEKQDWDPLSTTVDTANNTLTANLTHFSTVGVGGTSSASSSSSSSAGSSASAGTSSNSGGGRGSGGGGYFIRGATVSSMRESAGLVTEEQMRSAAVQEGAKLKVKILGKEITFKDVPATSWFAGPVAKILLAGIASGYKDEQGNLKGEYGPANNVTYAEIAKMALESAGHSASEDGGGAPPSNVSAKDHWSAGYIKIAEDMGLSVYKGRMNVNYSAKRGDVVQTMLEAVGILIQPRKELQRTFDPETGEEIVEPIDRYSDLSESHPRADAIYTATSLGIITGDTDEDGNRVGTVRVNDPINRAEVAKIFAEMIKGGYVD